MAATRGPASLLPTCIQFRRLWKDFHKRRYEQLGIRQNLRTSKPKKFASLLRGSRVNAGEVWRAPGSDTRYGIDLVPPKIGLPSDGG